MKLCYVQILMQIYQKSVTNIMALSYYGIVRLYDNKDLG